MNVKELLNMGCNGISVTLSPMDLKEFALAIIDEVRNEEAAKKHAVQSVERLTPKQVKEQYGLSLSTLWRWGKLGYLKPDKLGYHSFYKKSDIENLMSRREG